MAKKQSSKKSSKKTAATKKAAKATAAKKSLARSVAKSAAKSIGASPAKNVATVSAARKSSPPTLASQINLHQSSEYVRQNWWNWSVWIEAPANVLSKIEYVNYKLHSTFADPVRHHTNSQQKFLLKSAGWGEFTINAEIKPKDGNAFTKRHWLTLEYPQTAQTTKSASTSIKKEKRRPTVFLSAGLSDLRMSNALADALKKSSIEVLKTDALSPDLPWDVAISEIIKKSDLMVVLISGRPTSSTIGEIYLAKDRKLPIVPVLIGPDTTVPDELEGCQAINLKEANDGIAGDVAIQIIDTIKKLPPKA
jgi:pYEATS domain-containing protein involved in immunity/TIR domain-containing protein